MDQNHIIKKQVLDIALDSDMGLFSFKSEMSEIYHTEIVPLIDQYCSELSDSTEIHRIDRLEIDLGTIDPDNLTHDFKAKLSENLPKELTKALQSIRTEDEIFLDDSIKMRDPEAPENMRNKGGMEEFDLIAYYLETGRLPWWKLKEKQVNIADIIENQLEKPSSRFKHLLGKVINHPILVKRLVYQFSDNILEKIVGVFQTQNHDLICDARAELNDLLIDTDILKAVSPHQIRHEVWVSLLSNLTIAQKHFSESWEVARMVSTWISNAFQIKYKTLFDYIVQKSRWTDLENALTQISSITQNRVIANLVPDSKIILFKEAENLLEDLVHTSHDSPKYNESLQLLKSKLKELLTFCRSIDDKILVDQITLLIDSVERRSQTDSASIDTRKAESHEYLTKKSDDIAASRSKTFSDADEIFINNAGVILFWPYLGRLFETLGMLKEDQFTSRDKQERAVLILQYLVQGQQEFDEYDLTLNKLLCGLDPDTPIPTKLQLSEQEMAEANNLVTAVIQHWSALKEMSPAGLRKMFVIREGMITVRDGNWVLRVEEKAYDVLIDKMPWQISTVKLPWMKNLIFTEWRL